MNAFKRFLTTMREAVRGTIFLASAQVPVALLAMLAAATVVAIMVLVFRHAGGQRSTDRNGAHRGTQRSPVRLCDLQGRTAVSPFNRAS